MADIEPHEVPWPEATGYVCGHCGADIATEDGVYWWHIDIELQPKEEDDEPSS